jgi:hypothetical protein
MFMKMLMHLLLSYENANALYFFQKSKLSFLNHWNSHTNIYKLILPSLLTPALTKPLQYYFLQKLPCTLVVASVLCNKHPQQFLQWEDNSKCTQTNSGLVHLHQCWGKIKIVRGGRGEEGGSGGAKGGEITQTLYAHINKRKK